MSDVSGATASGGDRGPVHTLDLLLALLDARRRARVEPLLRALQASSSVVGLLVFGSFVSGCFDRDSDLDVVAVTRPGEPHAAEAIIDRCFPPETTVFRGGTSRYEWFGHLTSVWCAEPFLFGVDVGVVDESQLARLAVAPGSALLKDIGGRLAERMAATRAEAAERRARERVEEPYHLFSLLVKIRKALGRGHLWNAMDYVAQLRRTWMEWLREEAGRPNASRRPERGLEDVLGGPELDALASTLPGYDAASVRAAAGALAEHIVAIRGDSWSGEARAGVAAVLAALRGGGGSGGA